MRSLLYPGYGDATYYLSYEPSWNNLIYKPVCFCVSKVLLKKIEFFFYFLICFKLIFGIFRSFWCADIKNIFFFKKNIIMMHFRAKNTLKRNCYHTLKHLRPKPGSDIKCNINFSISLYLFILSIMIRM